MTSILWLKIAMFFAIIGIDQIDLCRYLWLYDNSDQRQIRTQFWNLAQIISLINVIT